MHASPSPQQWPDRVAPELRDFVQMSTDRLAGTGLVHAIYLHGSLVLGSYYEPKSDVDLLVLVTRRLAAQERREMSELVADLSDQRPMIGDIELSAITTGAAARFVYPTPFEVHYSSDWKQRIRSGDIDYDADRVDGDLACHISCARDSGHALLGPPAAETLGEVPREAFMASMMEDFDWIVADENILTTPYYGVLNACRALMVASGSERRTPSKADAGHWALTAVPEQRGIIERALAAYVSPERVTEEERATNGWSWSRDDLLQFRDHVRSQMRHRAS